MNCYRHTDTAALGICKNCNKGLCMQCLTDVGDGIACTETCTDEVRRMNRLIKVNTRRYSFSGILYTIIGAGVLTLHLLIFRPYNPIILGFAVFLLVYGLYLTFLGKKGGNKKPLDQF